MRTPCAILPNNILSMRAPYLYMCVTRDSNSEEPDRIPSTTRGAEPPKDTRDSGSARSHSTHLETSSSNRP